jgi:hypothetical protein
MESIEESVKEIGRKYTEQRKEIAERFQFEFDTEENRKIMNEQIKECETEYIKELRQKKIEHLLNDTIFRR